MPFVPPSQLTDITKASERKKLQGLLHERAVLGYAFSFRRLLKAFLSVGTDLDEETAKDLLMDCIAAHNDQEERAEKDRLNNAIGEIFTDNGITSLRDTDPFGRAKDYLMFESTSSSFSKERAVQIATSKYKVPAKTIQAIMDEATVKKPYVSFQARDVKENGEAQEKAS